MKHWTCTDEQSSLREQLHTQVWSLNRSIEALSGASTEEFVSALASTVVSQAAELASIAGRLDGLRIGEALTRHAFEVEQ